MQEGFPHCKSIMKIDILCQRTATSRPQITGKQKMLGISGHEMLTQVTNLNQQLQMTIENYGKTIKQTEGNKNTILNFRNRKPYL